MKQDPRLQGQAPGFRGGGVMVTGKRQDRNKTGTRWGQNKLKIGLLEA